MPTVLYHIKDFKKERKIVSLCRQMGFQVRSMRASDRNKTLGVLAGIASDKTEVRSGVAPAGVRVQDGVAPARIQPGQGVLEKGKEGNGSLPELLIFSGLKDQELEDFLEKYREEGIPPVDLKAVVTVHNLFWTAGELAAELQREHRETH